MTASFFFSQLKRWIDHCSITNIKLIPTLIFSYLGCNTFKETVLHTR